MSDLSLKEIQKEWHGSKRSYVIGFISSLVLTLAAFALVYLGKATIGVLISLGFVQAALQLRYFLHLGEEGHPKWETGFFVLMLVILLIVAIGTLWIMNDLNQRMMMIHD
ncbi:MAG: cytochrome o ubiquinol/quinol oxidase subunit IV [Parachlamydiaceae bacterium]